MMISESPSIYRPTKDIKLDDICRDRLSKYGIQVRRKAGSKYLFGPGGSMLVVREQGGSVYFENAFDRAPMLVMHALTNEFEMELYDITAGTIWGMESWNHASVWFDHHDNDSEGDLEPEAAMVLVEGPEYCDAKFVSSWLQAAIDADSLMESYAVSRSVGMAEGLTLADIYHVNVGAMALRYTRKFLTKRGVFATNVSEPPYHQIFPFMVTLGFFTRTGNRYQMTVPKVLDDGAIAEALRFIFDEDANWVSDEKLVHTHTRQTVTALKEKLRSLDDVERLEHRAALLAAQTNGQGVEPKRKRSRR